MSSTPVDKLSASEISQLSLSYAAFILSDAGAKVTAQTLQAVLDAAGLKTEKLWVDLFAKTLANKSVDSFFSSGSSSAGTGAGPAAPAAEKVVEKGGKKEEKKEEKKPAAKKEAPPPEPEDDMDMGGLFE